jgi:hypothetical protein
MKIIYESKTIITKTEAQLGNGPQGQAIYECYGKDEHGQEYHITWPIINHDCDDESNACNWNNYTIRPI